MNYYKVTVLEQPFTYYMQFEEHAHQGTIVQVNDETGENLVLSGGVNLSKKTAIDRRHHVTEHIVMDLYFWTGAGNKIILVKGTVPNILEPSTEEEYFKIMGII